MTQCTLSNYKCDKGPNYNFSDLKVEFDEKFNIKVARPDYLQIHCPRRTIAGFANVLRSQDWIDGVFVNGKTNISVYLSEAYHIGGWGPVIIYLLYLLYAS
jgi:hypothetical protein